MNTEKREIKIGKKYRHFKGNEYLVLHVAKHSENKPAPGGNEKSSEHSKTFYREAFSFHSARDGHFA